MFGFRSENMKIAQANAAVLDSRVRRLTTVVSENEKFVTECLTNNTILFDRINELEERLFEMEKNLRMDAGDGTDF